MGASLIIVLTRGGTTASLVAKYRPAVPIISVAVPVLTTDDLTWSISDDAPARHALVRRGLIPILAEGATRSTDSDTTDELINAALEEAKARGLCKPKDSVVALHRIGAASVIKIACVK